MLAKEERATIAERIKSVGYDEYLKELNEAIKHYKKLAWEEG